MSYSKTTWVDGTTEINASRLNNIEGGVESNDTGIEELNTGRCYMKRTSGSNRSVTITSSNTSAQHFLAFNRFGNLVIAYQFSNASEWTCVSFGDQSTSFTYNGNVITVSASSTNGGYWTVIGMYDFTLS